MGYSFNLNFTGHICKFFAQMSWEDRRGMIDEKNCSFLSMWWIFIEISGVTENKYSQEKSTPGVLISQEINTPRYFFPRKFIPPLGNLYSPTNNTLFPRKGAHIIYPGSINLETTVCSAFKFGTLQCRSFWPKDYLHW